MSIQSDPLNPISPIDWQIVQVINRPCGHSYATDCRCAGPNAWVTTTANFAIYGEYVGRHRADAPAS